MADVLIEEMHRHWADQFPDSVTKGLDYGDVDPVMIGPDICGWALAIASASEVSQVDHGQLRQAAEQLRRSIPVFPAEAQPYYERILRIAELALAR